MTEPSQGPKQKKPAPKPGKEMTEGDLDKVSGGVAVKLSPPSPPAGPVAIPYPNET